MAEDEMKEQSVQAVKHLRPVPSPPEELEVFFREHHDQVFRTAYRVTGSPSDAEDVLQTVFLRLVRRKEKIDLSPSPGGIFIAPPSTPRPVFCPTGPARAPGL